MRVAHSKNERPLRRFEVLLEQVTVTLDPTHLPEPAQCVLERFVRDSHHNGGEHLNEATVGVEGEVTIIKYLSNAARYLVVEADVEHGVHHAGHRELCPAPARKEKRASFQSAVPQP